MSSLTLSPAPGAYPGAQAVTFTPSDDVDYYLIGSGNIPPAISEYIAYDQLNPPNPFLAVTQDGKGNVVYDGGFPKFYNSLAPDAGTAFDRLLGAHKFFYNALRFIAHEQKWADGNRKVLVLGDANASESYSIKSTGASGFYTTLSRLFVIAGFQATFKDISDYGGSSLNPTLSELDQYVCVVLMSSLSTGVNRLTDPGETALVSYRSLGGGLFICTDHGRNIATIDGAWPAGSGSFFNTANKVARNFGAWFSGDYNRSPVNAGFLRRTYGDHPLYNNIPDSDDIYAGGSESRVFVAEYPKYSKDSPAPAKSVSGTGTQYVRTIAKMKDGTIVPETYVYVLGNGEAPVAHINASGQAITGLTLDKYRYAPSLRINHIQDTEMMGFVEAGGLLIGEFRSSNAEQSFRWYHDPTNQAATAPEILLNTGDVVRLNLRVPFAYNNVLPVVVDAPKVTSPKSLTRILSGYGKRIFPRLEGLALYRRLNRTLGKRTLTDMAQTVIALGTPLDPAVTKRYTVVTTTPTMTLAQARAKYSDKDGLIIDSPHTRGEIPWDQITNEWASYRMGFSGWEALGISIVDVFGVNATLVSKDSGAEYFIDLNRSITRIK